HSLSGSQSGILVAAASVSQLVVAGFNTPTTAGATHSFTVTAKDAFGNAATGFTGTVTFTSSDAQAHFPTLSYTFTGSGLDNGVTSSTGTVILTSSDGQVVFDTNSYHFTSGGGMDNGVHVFHNAILKTAGTQSITGTDAGSLTGSQASITVTANTATQLLVS